MRVKKREVVIPFDGEENFVVPKRGGFGQPDNENYAMAVGINTPIKDIPNDPTNTGISGTTNTNTTINTTPPTSDETTPSPAPLTPQQLCVANGDTWVNGVCQPKAVVDEPSPAQTTCIANGGTWVNGACVTTTNPKILATTTTPTTTTVADAPVVDTLPNFPVWSSLDCTTLRDKITEYNAILSTSRFTQEIINAYNTEIAKAQFLYNTKCNVTPPAPAPSPSPAPAPITILPVNSGIGIGSGSGSSGSGGSRGGGSGFGKPPSDDESKSTTTKIEGKKKNYWGIILIIGGIGLLYLLTRKKKQ
jgi:hypothetical protein